MKPEEPLDPRRPGTLGDPLLSRGGPGRSSRDRLLSLRLAIWPPTLQRTVVHYRRYGARRTLTRGLAELGLERADLQGLFRRRSSIVALSPGLREVQRRRIAAHLDKPLRDGVESSASMLVSGWTFGASPIASATVYVDGSAVKVADVGQPRPDVGALHRRQPDAGRSGFTARVPIAGLEPGEHTVHVAIEDTQGARRVLSRSFLRIEPELLYHQYYERALPTAAEEAALARTALAHAPPVELLVGPGPDVLVHRTVRSIERQRYPRLSVRKLADGMALSAALPAQVDASRYVGFLAAGEALAPASLLRFADRAAASGAVVIYSDHDAIDETGRHVQPWFVPDWSADHALSQDYVGGFYLARDSTALRTAIAASAVPDDPAWRYGLLLELTASAVDVGHVPEVLWSRPAPEAADARIAESELAAVRGFLARHGRDTDVDTVHVGRHGSIRSIRYPLRDRPFVSIVVPTTGRPELVRQLLASLAATDYPDRELIVLDNSRGREPEGIAWLRGQEVTLIERDEPFNWARLNNAGAGVARGELLLFLNDDVVATDPDWLSALVRQAQRPDVGAVGPFMSYPDGSVQHAGVLLVGHGGGAVHLFHGLDPEEDLYLDWHLVQREVMALTGACLMVPRDVFQSVGGFDERLAVVGNDVDLCLRIARTGRRVLVEPASRLVHQESQSRSGVDHIPDEGRIWDRWSDVLTSGDPRYNVNLTESHVDAGLAWQRVARRLARPAAGPAEGVNLVGYIRAEMGVGQAARADALALTAADIPFVVIDHGVGTPARQDDATWVHRIVEEPVFDTNILHINADLLPQAVRQLPSHLTRKRRNVGYWTWELSEFPAAWRAAYALVDEVWVPSTFVQSALGSAAPVPVRVVPHAMRRPRGPFLDRAHFGLVDGAVQFLTMYDTQSVMERKNPQGVIQAFTRAFDGTARDAVLVVKVNTAGDREVAQLRELIGSRSDIRLLTNVLSRHETDSLMAGSDVFVSLHRSEGFGLAIAEAMMLGRPVIATGWSGNMDFMSTETAACIDYELVPLRQSHGPYQAGLHWAEPDVDQAAEWMRRLCFDAGLRQRMGALAERAVESSLDPFAVGSLMARYLPGKP